MTEMPMASKPGAVAPAVPADPARGPRRFATGMLVAAAGLFLVAEYMRGTAPVWDWLRAFSEAAMVGGLADWFAVTALFRHPLGLPIPHTALVPANKERIATTMAGFLQGNFLTPAVVARRLGTIDLAGAVGGFLTEPGRGGEARLREGVADALNEAIRALEDERVGTMVKSRIREQVEKINLAPLAGELLGAMVEQGRHIPLLEAVLHHAGVLLEDNEDLLRATINKNSGSLMRWTGMDAQIANTVLEGLYRLLDECSTDPNHALRVQLEESVTKLADDLVGDPEMHARIARFQAEALANPALAEWLERLAIRARAAIQRAATDPQQVLAGKLSDGLAGFGEALQANARLRNTVNRVARRAMVGLVNRHGSGIVTLVSETVRRWDARTLTGRIEAIVGADLQYIRMNGTLVGGIVGLALHACEKLV